MFRMITPCYDRLVCTCFGAAAISISIYPQDKDAVSKTDRLQHDAIIHTTNISTNCHKDLITSSLNMSSNQWFLKNLFSVILNLLSFYVLHIFRMYCTALQFQII